MHKAVSRNFAYEMFAVQLKTYLYLNRHVSYDIRTFSDQAHTCIFAAPSVGVTPSCVSFKTSTHIIVSCLDDRKYMPIRFHQNAIFCMLFTRGPRVIVHTDYTESNNIITLVLYVIAAIVCI